MKEAALAQGLFGYTTYDAVQFFDTIRLAPKPMKGPVCQGCKSQFR